MKNNIEIEKISRKTSPITSINPFDTEPPVTTSVIHIDCTTHDAISWNSHKQLWCQTCAGRNNLNEYDSVKQAGEKLT